MRTDLSEWPGGVEPVWRLLEPASVVALRAEPSAANRTIRLAADLPDEEFRGSAFARNALIVLQRVDRDGWLWLTDKGNFRRDVVAAMRESMTWPGMEATEHFRTGKAYREGDVWELHLLHRLLDMAGLVEERAGLCRLTALGREMLGPGDGARFRRSCSGACSGAPNSGASSRRFRAGCRGDGRRTTWA